MTVDKRSLDEALGFTLSAQQWAVVSAPLEPAVVVAGAGSGKTTVMAARVAWLIGSGLIAPDAALGLTFTTKAAASLLARMRDSLRRLQGAGLVISPPTDDDLPSEPEVLTYNAFAARILRDHGVRLGREPGATILTDGARQQLAYRVVCRTSLPLQRIGKTPITITSDLLALDDQLSELDLDPQQLIDDESAFLDQLQAFAPLQRIGETLRDTAQARSLLAQLIVQWRAEKAARDLLDFTDQTRLALQLVRTYPEVASAVRARHGVVLLDEYQDTSIAQRALLQCLFAGGHPVTAVGDPCQAIYGWRGASVDNIERFGAHFPVVRNGIEIPGERYSLTSNRRSGPGILAVANELSRDLRERHTGVGVLEAAADGKGAGHVRVGLFETAADERAWIADEIAAAKPAKWSEIAVLAATGRDLADLDELLRARGVPTQLYGAAGLLRQPAVVEARSMLEVLHDPIANPAIVRLLSGARWRIGPRDLAALGARAAELAGRAGRVQTSDVEGALDEAVAGADPVEITSLSDAVFDLGPASAYSPQAYARLTAFAAEVRALRRHVGEPVADLIARVGRETGLEVELALSADPEQQRQAWSTFLELASEFNDIDGTTSLGAFLSRLRDAERFEIDLSVDLATQENAVQLLTVHKAKGLEFTHVFVMSMAEQAFPGGKARGEWPKSAAVVPWRLREDRTADLVSFPDPAEGPRAKHYEAYREVLQELLDTDADRLAYVALTRAERSLAVTGHWWGPSQATRRGPEPYLRSVREVVESIGGEVVVWHPEPADGAKNPSPSLGARGLPWPAEVTSADAITAAGERVRAYLDTPEPLPGMPVLDPGLSQAERALAERWDLDAQALLAEARGRLAPVVSVPLPASLSATAAIAALRDPDAFALAMARPMPSAPADAARRGTAFHAWVETQFGQQSLLDPDDLPGAGDDDIVSDAQLVELQHAFARTAFAARTPVAIEEPFALVVGGVVLRGRIDAVFADGDRFEVIDWKTGKAGNADPLQLALYRIAWSQLRDIPIDRIDAAFVEVATGEVVRPTELPDLKAIEALLFDAE